MCICTVFRYFNLLQFILTHILKVILLAGVTGSGKTEIALRIMKQYNAHLISCDSVQIYDKLSILSNKPAELDTHTLLHFYNFKSQYDITKYVEDVNKELKMCLAKNKIPIIVGGTGFYFSKLNLEQYDVIKIFLTQKRETLYERLDARCEDMILNGMLDEVKEAKREGLTLDHILGKSIGCRDGLIFLGNCENEPMKYLEHFKSFIGNFKRRTRNYARKQECWFRKTDFAWVDIDNYDAFDIIINFLNEEHVNDLQEIDTISRDINNNARKRMKTFESAESKISQQTIDDIVKNIRW